MKPEEKLEHLRQIRELLDELCPDWRTAELPSGKPPARIEFHVQLKSGELLKLVLFQRPEEATEAEGEDEK